MSAVWYPFGMMAAARDIGVPDDLFAAPGYVLTVQRLPGESIGTFTLELANLVVGSAIQIETQAGSAVANRTAATPTETFLLPAYAAGTAPNSLRIKVRKGSAPPFYQPYETQATAFVGSQSIFVSQNLDE
jgi:hypothetical protein